MLRQVSRNDTQKVTESSGEIQPQRSNASSQSQSSLSSRCGSSNFFTQIGNLISQLFQKFLNFFRSDQQSRPSQEQPVRALRAKPDELDLNKEHSVEAERPPSPQAQQEIFEVKARITSAVLKEEEQAPSLPVITFDQVWRMNDLIPSIEVPPGDMLTSIRIEVDRHIALYKGLPPAIQKQFTDECEKRGVDIDYGKLDVRKILRLSVSSFCLRYSISSLETYIKLLSSPEASLADKDKAWDRLFYEDRAGMFHKHQMSSFLSDKVESHKQLLQVFEKERCYFEIKARVE